MSKPKYYNGDELLSRHYMLNMICGSRFGGKSTWAQRYVVKRCIRNHEDQFAIIVRYDTDMTALCETYFNNTMRMWYPDYTMEYKTGKFYLVNKMGSKILVGYCFALNKATRKKSTSYPLINTLILEEFINLEGKYIKNQARPELECELLISLIQTIFRGNGKQFRDDGRVFCISNNYSLNNPYFRYFGVIDKIVADPFKRFYKFNARLNPDGSVDKPAILIETVNNDIKDGLGANASGSKFIDLRNELHIVKNQTVKKPLIKLSFNGQDWIALGKYNDSMLVFKSNGDNDGFSVRYSCSDIRKIGIQFIDNLRSTPLYKTMESVFNKNAFYYDCLESYMTLYNIFLF